MDLFPFPLKPPVVSEACSFQDAMREGVLAREPWHKSCAPKFRRFLTLKSRGGISGVALSGTGSIRPKGGRVDLHRIEGCYKVVDGGAVGPTFQQPSCCQANSKTRFLVNSCLSFRGTWHTQNKETIQFVTTSDPRLLKNKNQSQTTQSARGYLHTGLPGSIEKAVSDKRILLWQNCSRKTGTTT